MPGKIPQYGLAFFMSSDTILFMVFIFDVKNPLVTGFAFSKKMVKVF